MKVQHYDNYRKASILVTYLRNFSSVRLKPVVVNRIIILAEIGTYCVDYHFCIYDNILISGPYGTMPNVTERLSNNPVVTFLVASGIYGGFISGAMHFLTLEPALIEEISALVLDPLSYENCRLSIPKNLICAQRQIAAGP